jgi:ATP-binding cassette, subfamily B, bacterial
MPSAAFDRARKLLNGARPGAVFRARALGIIQSLLALALLGVAALACDLVTSGGRAEVLNEDFNELPTWVTNRAIPLRPSVSLVEDSGLFSIIAANIDSANPLHRGGARILSAVLTALPNLQYNKETLSFLVMLALTLLLMLALTSRLRRTALAEAATAVASQLRKQIHRQMYRLGQSSLPTEGTGPVVNLFTREVNDVRDGLYHQLDIGWRMPLLAFGLVCFVVLVSWRSTIFLISLGALVWWAASVLRKSSSMLSTIAVRDAALQLGALQEDLSLLRIVRVHGMEEVDKSRFDEHLERFTEADARRIVAEGHGRVILFLLFGAAAVLGLAVLAYGVVVNHHSPTSALFLVAALGGLLVPIRELAKMRRAVRQAERSAGAIYDYLDRSTELHQAGGAHFLAPLKTRISFENVTLEGPNSRKLLDGLSVEIKAGSRVAIMSPDEDSKYALACLIPRLIDPKIGRVRIDGVDLRDVTLESVRAQVSTVLQADLVFSDTVFANIALGDSSYDLPRVMEAAKLAHAHQFIQDLPEGYETTIGPLGTYLTIDQRYRIGLARAALHDPSIVIIEEPDVPIDDDVKPLLDDTLNRLAAHRTIIILPHRLSTIRSCDQVIVIQNGRLEAVGAPREVHSSSKLYRHLQYTEFNQFATGEVEAGQMGV